MNKKKIEAVLKSIKSILKTLNEDEKIDALNTLKIGLHEISPMKNEPVDCVLWVKSHSISANDYNPNAVAPPEMELLKLSILEDGYTQPVVTFQVENNREVVDGFHRTRVGKECEEVKQRIKGFLPVVTINQWRIDKGDRMAATVRHNRARGKHQVGKMSDIILELKRRNWKDEKIAKHLGMEPDEVLRLAQITGLAEMFKDREFNKSWEAISFEDKQENIDE